MVFSFEMYKQLATLSYLHVYECYGVLDGLVHGGESDILGASVGPAADGVDFKVGEQSFIYTGPCEDKSFCENK